MFVTFIEFDAIILNAVFTLFIQLHYKTALFRPGITTILLRIFSNSHAQNIGLVQIYVRLFLQVISESYCYVAHAFHILYHEKKII